METKENQQLSINISDEVAKGTYSNVTVITHSTTEFIMDFAQVMPGNKNAVVRQRTVMTPINAKRLLMTLNDNIKRYEEQFGTIEELRSVHEPIPFDMVPQGKA